MDFPIGELMDESACYEFLVGLLHPDGLACPHCGDRDHLKVHRRDRAPILAYRCTACRRISTAFTGTVLQGTKRRPIELVLILRGIAQGVSTAQLARELECSRPELLEFRHRLQALGGGESRPDAAGRCRDRGRRDVPGGGGKKASPTATRTTRRGIVPTRPGAM